MRNLQFGNFVPGSIGSVLSAVFKGGRVGDTLWRTGAAAMPVVPGMRALWPVVGENGTKNGRRA